MLDIARSGTTWRAEPGWLNTATCWLPPDSAWDAVPQRWKQWEALTVAAVHDHDVALADRFHGRLGLPPGDSAIVSAQLEGADERLARAGIRMSARAGRLRASFHLYNTEAEVGAALGVLAG